MGGRSRGRPAGSRNRIRGTLTRSIAATGAGQLLSQMQAYHNNLNSQRVTIDTEIDAIARAMQALGGSRGTRTRGPRRGRGRIARRRRGPSTGRGARAGSLKEFIARVLRQSSKPMSPNEIGVNVMRAGFKTKSRDLTKAVSNTLPQVKGVRRVGFGAYRI